MQKPCLRIVDHMAPEAFYELCDRAGLIVLQDTPPVAGFGAAFPESDWHSELAEIVGRLSVHSCVANVEALDADLARETKKGATR